MHWDPHQVAISKQMVWYTCQVCWCLLNEQNEQLTGSACIQKGAFDFIALSLGVIASLHSASEQLLPVRPSQTLNQVNNMMLVSETLVISGLMYWACPTYGDLLFTQVCSDPAQMYCSYVQGKMQLPQFSTALQNRLTPGSVSQQIHLWKYAVYTGVQWPTTNALQLCSGHITVPVFSGALQHSLTPGSVSLQIHL